MHTVVDYTIRHRGERGGTAVFNTCIHDVCNTRIKWSDVITLT